MSFRLRPGAYLGETRDRRAVAGLTLTRTVHRLPARLPLHTHEAPYFCLVMDGAFDERAGRAVLEARPGMLLYHPAGESHADQIRSGRTQLLNIALDDAWMGRIDQLGTPLRPGLQSAQAARVARRVADEMSVLDRTSTLAIEGLVLTLIGAAADSPARFPGGLPPWLPVALDFIRARFLGRFDHDDLARVAGVHPTHLARAFRGHTGLTVTAYVHRLRIEFACRRLAARDATLVQVALEAGFADHAHFTRVFRRVTGTTPSDYRQRVRPGRA